MTDRPSGRPVAIGLSLIVLTAIAVGLYLVGSPGRAREQALDERRVQDLRENRAQVSAFWRTHKLLPATLESAATTADDSLAHRDPVAGTPYEYRVTSDSTYDLCATFSHPSRNARSADDSWRHPSGRYCYPFTLRD